MKVHISTKVLAKLSEKHGVTRKEVEECFQNRTGHLLMETREQHKSDPPTLWFIAHTNKGRLLKVCLVLKGGQPHIRTAYSPNDIELGLYRNKGKPSDF